VLEDGVLLDRVVAARISLGRVRYSGIILGRVQVGYMGAGNAVNASPCVKVAG